MAKVQVTGLEELMKKYEKLGGSIDKVAKKTLYDGAGVFADGLKAEVESIPTDNDNSWGHIKAGPTTLEKEGLRQTLGIAHFAQKGTEIDTSISFDGYTLLRTKSWPKGVPAPLVARAVESGTSWMKKTPFVARARRKYKVQAQAKMERTLIKEIEKIMK